MSELSLPSVKSGLVEAGIEIYCVRGVVVEVAERIRLHLMDSGIRVVTGNEPEVRFTARAQRSENQSLPPPSQFDKVRSVVGALAEQNGWAEIEATPTDVRDPVDKSKILDVWYEITFAKRVASLAEATDAVRWALGVEKYVQG
ncbi:MAG: hypothetical protein HYY06_10555 [Deltaproteobacteria bacterium]|nr:hypothetical protein [Deltaproteobacteria bacterium]